MKWRFDDLSTFLTVVEAGGITAAANHLNLAKSVVSKRISALEAALDVELLVRSSRAVRPTEHGQALYDRMRPLIHEMGQAAERISSGAGSLTGRLRITAPMSFGTMHLSPIIAAFVGAHAELEMAIDLDDRFVDLVHGGYDVGIRIGLLPDSSMIARKLCEVRRVVLCSPGYAQARGLPRDVADLARHACIDYAHVHASQLWQFEAAGPGGRPGSVALRSRIVVNNGEVMRDLAIAGLGVVVLPMFLAVDALRDGRLIEALPDALPRPYAIHAVWPQTNRMSAKVRAFVDHLATAFAGGAPWERGTPPAPHCIRLNRDREP